MRVFDGISISLLLLISGCGDSVPRVEPPPFAPLQAPPPEEIGEPGEGIWQGTMASSISGNTLDVVGLVNSWGELRLLTDQGQFIGQIRISGDSITSRLTGISAEGFRWPDDSTIGDFSFSGDYLHRSAIEGDYSGAGDDGTISLEFDPASDRISEIDRVVGMWALRDTLQNITATLEIDRVDMHGAAIAGSNVDGCIFNGELESWTSAFVFDVWTLSVSNCPSAPGQNLNGEYEGLGAVRDRETGSNLDDEFILGIDGDGRVITIALEKI